MSKLSVLNLFGGPSSTKSTTAHGVMYELKAMKFSCEFVGEFAKDMVWDGNYEAMASDQIYIFGEQNHRLNRLIGKVDWAITDTSIVLGCIYADAINPLTAHLNEFILETFRTYRNLNYFIERPPGFEAVGRVENLEESIAIDNRTKDFLDDNHIPYKCLPAGRDAVSSIVSDIYSKQWVAPSSYVV